MTENTESIYDIEFKDIYEIEFLDLEEPTSEVSSQLAESKIYLDTPKLNNGVTSGSLGAVSLEAVIEVGDTPTNEAAPRDTYLNEVLSDKGNSKLDEKKIEVPEELQTKVNQAIDKILRSTSKAIIPYRQLIKKTFGNDDCSATEKLLLGEAIKNDGRVEHFRSGCYLVVDRSEQVIEVYKAGKDPFVDSESITRLVERVVKIIRTHENGFVPHGNVLGAINSVDGYLNEFEISEIFVRLNTHSAVTPLPSGNFTFHVPVSQQESNDELSEHGPKPLGLVSRNGKALTSKQTNKALNNINSSKEVRDARDRENRVANPRRHGRNFRRKGSRMQGKAHGKKVSIDKLLSQINNPSQPK